MEEQVYRLDAWIHCEQLTRCTCLIILDSHSYTGPSHTCLLRTACWVLPFLGVLCLEHLLRYRRSGILVGTVLGGLGSGVLPGLFHLIGRVWVIIPTCLLLPGTPLPFCCVSLSCCHLGTWVPAAVSHRRFCISAYRLPGVHCRSALYRRRLGKTCGDAPIPPAAVLCHFLEWVLPAPQIFVTISFHRSAWVSCTANACTVLFWVPCLGVYRACVPGMPPPPVDLTLHFLFPDCTIHHHTLFSTWKSLCAGPAILQMQFSPPPFCLLGCCITDATAWDTTTWSAAGSAYTCSTMEHHHYLGGGGHCISPAHYLSAYCHFLRWITVPLLLCFCLPHL